MLVSLFISEILPTRIKNTVCDTVSCAYDTYI